MVNIRKSSLGHFIQSRFGKQVLFIVAFWYLAMWPGRLGYDYSLAIRMIRAGESTNWWTAAYFRFLEFTTFYGRTIFLTSIIGLISLAYGIWFFLSSVIKDSAVLQKTYLAILLTPLFGVFGVTVSHDVFQTAGIITFLGLLVRARGDYLTPRIFVLNYLFASVCILTVKTGLPSFLMLTIVFFLSRFRFLALKASIPIILIALVSNVGIGPSIIKHPGPNVLFSDLKCVAQHPEADISQDEWAALDNIAPHDLWLIPITCSNPDLQIKTLGISEVDVKLSNSFYLDYLKVVSKNPLIVIQAHIQKSLGALPPPFFPGPENQVDRNFSNPVGYGVNTALQKGPELLHPSIDEPTVAVKVSFLLPLQALAQTATFVINQSSWFWAWGGLWLWPILYFYIGILKFTKWTEISIALLPILLLHSANVLLGPGPLGRYYMSTILVGSALTFSMFFSWVKKVRTDAESN